MGGYPGYSPSQSTTPLGYNCSGLTGGYPGYSHRGTPWPGLMGGTRGTPHPGLTGGYLGYPHQGTHPSWGTPVRVPPSWGTPIGVPPVRVCPHSGTPQAGPGSGTPPPPDLARVPPPPPQVWTDRWMDGWMDRHVSKQNLPVVVRTWSVKICESVLVQIYCISQVSKIKNKRHKFLQCCGCCEFNSHWRQLYFLQKLFKTLRCKFCTKMPEISE